MVEINMHRTGSGQNGTQLTLFRYKKARTGHPPPTQKIKPSGYGDGSMYASHPHTDSGPACLPVQPPVQVCTLRGVYTGTYQVRCSTPFGWLATGSNAATALVCAIHEHRARPLRQQLHDRVHGREHRVVFYRRQS